jgi:hypothetical protein
MTMTQLEVRAFNLVDQHGSTKGFHLKRTPTIDASTKLWQFIFTNGSEDRIVPLFEEDLMRDASAGVLSDDTKRKIDAELAPLNLTPNGGPRS